MKKLNAKFDFIRYSNVWEDPEMLILDGPRIEGKKVLSIASAGDNCFALLAQNPSAVVGVDVSEVQLFLTQLKAAAIQRLPLRQTEQFLGFIECSDRLSIYLKLRIHLTKPCQKYWDNHINEIQRGVIHMGKFEKYLRLFAHRILPLIHRKRTIEELFEPKTVEEQRIFFNKKWNTLRWKVLFRIFFSKMLMGWLGRDRSFLKEVNVSVSQFMLDKAAMALSDPRICNNHIMKYCLTGSYGTLRPYYLQKENYSRIQTNMHKLKLERCYVDEMPGEYGKFDYFNLSNIFEYMDKVSFETVKKAILRLSNENAVFAYWNLMVPRKIANTISLKSDKKPALDRGFFYHAFHLDQLTYS